MAVLSSIENKPDLRGYASDPMHALAESFLDTARSAKQEAGLDIFGEPGRFMQDTFTKNQMKKFFVENSYDQADPRFQNPDVLQEHIANMESLFENDASQIMQESANIGAYNPVIGMALPMHKNILMNAVFDQALPKDVAKGPKFTLTMEVRTMTDINGNVIDLFAEQNKIKKAVDESIPKLDIVLKDTDLAKATDMIQKYKDKAILASTDRHANISMKTYVCSVIVEGVATAGAKIVDTVDEAGWEGAHEVDPGEVGTDKLLVYRIEGKFTPGYGANANRTLNKRIALTVPTDNAGGTEDVYMTLMGNIEDNKATLMASALGLQDGSVPAKAKFKGLVVHSELDVSTAAFPTVKTGWSATTDFFEIPEAPHITCPITPEAVKDIQAMYDVNQVTKLMSLMRLILLHYKDDKIRENLDESFLAMPSTNKVFSSFDFTPPSNYNNNPVEWRKVMFMDNLDMQVTRMLQVLNDENMTIAVFGRPELIKRITPQHFTYQTPSNIGPVELDFTRTVVTSEKRAYNFISVNKMRNNNNLIVLLIPRNSMRITYKVIDYQMYISSEIRDHNQYELPAMTCFERWLFLSYQPVQGRIRIMNPSGLRENIQMPSENDYLGVNSMNDFTANSEQYASEVNGVIDPKTGHIVIPPIKTV